MKDIIALDLQSVRQMARNGTMNVQQTNITKEDVNPYYGKEIPNFDALGLDPNQIYYLYRPADELEKAVQTFNRLPILNKHIPIQKGIIPKENVAGCTGSDAVFDNGFVKSSISIWDGEAIAGVESEQQKELSLGYYYDANMTPGEFNGKKYDGRMENIEGNHLALVPKGRAGRDVVVADHDPFYQQEAKAMRVTKLGKALIAAIGAASPKLAQDSKLSAVLGGAKKGFKKADAVKTLLGMDAELNAEQLDGIIDAILGVEQGEPEGQPESGEEVAEDGEELFKFLKEKGLSDEDLDFVKNLIKKPVAEDEYDINPNGEPKKDMDENKNETAMDAELLRKQMRKEFADLEKAKAAVRSVVGDLIGMDSSESVFRFALDQMGVPHKNTNAGGLSDLFAAANRKPTSKKIPLAMDEDGVKTPDLSRFGRR